MRKREFIRPEEDETAEKFSIYTKITCDYCGLEYEYAERWAHINRHRQGLGQLTSRLSVFDVKSARLPWYMHSIYQDRSVNRSRFEIMQFTELTRDSPLYNMENKIKKPFATHFWINYEGKKTGDVVKDFFGLRPYTVDYSVFDRYLMCEQEDHSPGLSATEFECALCRRKIHKCPTLIQTITAALVHALGDHSKNQELYNACMADIEAIQEATGIQMFLKTLPDYNPIILDDLLFDYYYSRDIFSAQTSGCILYTYCMLCFKLIGSARSYMIKTHFLKEHKDVEAAHTISEFDCIPAARYGHSVSIGCKNCILPCMLVESEDKTQFSWACFMCNTVLKHADSTQLIFYVAAHMSNKLGNCLDPRLKLTSQRDKTAIQKNIENFFLPYNECKKTIGSWNTRIKPLTPKTVKGSFLKLSVRDFLDKWIFRFKGDTTITGHVELCNRFNEFKRTYDASGKVKSTSIKGWIYICPYCFGYFINKYAAFLHLQPGECPQMKGFKLPLDANCLEKARRKDLYLSDGL